MNTEEINRKYNELAEETTNFYNTLMAKIEANKNEAINKAEQNHKVGKFVKVNSGGRGAVGCGYIGKLIEKPIKKPLKYSGKYYEVSKTFVLCYSSSRVWGLAEDCNIEDATESEVLDFLKQEAEERYKEGDEVKSVSMKQNVKYPFNDMTCITKDYFVYNGISVLDLNSGEWSEVVEKKEEKEIATCTVEFRLNEKPKTKITEKDLGELRKNYPELKIVDRKQISKK